MDSDLSDMDLRPEVELIIPDLDVNLGSDPIQHHDHHEQNDMMHNDDIKDGIQQQIHQQQHQHQQQQQSQPHHHQIKNMNQRPKRVRKKPEPKLSYDHAASGPQMHVPKPAAGASGQSQSSRPMTHPCKECQAIFASSGELIRHVRYKHTFERPYKCTECDYASVELSKLKRHMRSHTGERPYHCPHCSYSSPDTYKLKRHLRTHTGEKPYECHVCKQRFTQSNSLKSHQLIHSTNRPVFKCEYCPATCGRKTDLRIHVQKLHEPLAKPLICKKCDQPFHDRYHFKIHSQSHK